MVFLCGSSACYGIRMTCLLRLPECAAHKLQQPFVATDVWWKCCLLARPIVAEKNGDCPLAGGTCVHTAADDERCSCLPAGHGPAGPQPAYIYWCTLHHSRNICLSHALLKDNTHSTQARLWLRAMFLLWCYTVSVLRSWCNHFCAIPEIV